MGGGEGARQLLAMSLLRNGGGKGTDSPLCTALARRRHARARPNEPTHYSGFILGDRWRPRRKERALCLLLSCSLSLCVFACCVRAKDSSEARGEGPARRGGGGEDVCVVVACADVAFVVVSFSTTAPASPFRRARARGEREATTTARSHDDGANVLLVVDRGPPTRTQQLSNLIHPPPE